MKRALFKKQIFFVLTFSVLAIIGLSLFLIINFSSPKTEVRLVSSLQDQTIPEKNISPSINEAQKKKEEEKKKAEETRRFIEQYGPCRYLPVLTYHHIGDGTDSLFVKTDTFASQMEYLARKGYTTITLVDLVNNLQNGTPLPAKPIILTFDDGYRDFYENAYPILKAHNFKATLFVITQFVGGSAYLQYVTWDQLAQMSSSGLVTIGDHTLSHLPLPSLLPDRVKDEIISAKNILESRLGKHVDVFAYPYGSDSDESEKVLREGGFAVAVTTKRGLACAKLPYEIPRIRMGNAPIASYGF
ncbi:MAG: polysaccharide deacetylase family protein [bacterium]|nr:polysaccharide deacetylase family protein [bacterium]